MNNAKKLVKGQDGTLRKETNNVPTGSQPVANAGFSLKLRPKAQSNNDTMPAPPSPPTKQPLFYEDQGLNWETPTPPAQNGTRGISPKPAQRESMYQESTYKKTLPPPPPLAKKVEQGTILLGVRYDESQYGTRKGTSPGRQDASKNRQVLPTINESGPIDVPQPSTMTFGEKVEQDRQQLNIKDKGPPPQFPSFGANLQQPYNIPPPVAPSPVLNTFGRQPPLQSYQPPAQQTYQPVAPPYQPPPYQQPSYQQPPYQQPSYQQPSYQQPSISEPKLNEQWYELIEDKRLNWQNHKNFPYEVLVMLNDLSVRYSSPPTITRQESHSSKQRQFSVSKPKSLNEHIDQYKGNARLQQNLRQKLSQYPIYREVRGDGNCFYRAFACGYLEMALRHNTAGYFLRLLFEFMRIGGNFVTDCKQPEMLPPEELYHFLMHRLLQLYSYRVELAESQEDPVNQKQKITEFLYAMINTRPFQFDMYLMIAIKSYTLWLVKNEPNYRNLGEEFLYEPMQQIPIYGLECANNELCINSLVNGLKVTMDFFEETKTGNTVSSRRYYPEEYRQAEQLAVFFRPGHYDLIYNIKACKECYMNLVR